MENKFLDKYKNTITLRIKGKNIERFIKRLNSFNIDLLEIKYLKYNETKIKIYKYDLEKLMEIKTIYEIEIIDYNGIDKIKSNIKINRYLIISCIISLIVLILLCNTIFDVKVIHNNEEIRNIILKELNNEGISKYKFKKNYKDIQKIKMNILNKYKDKIEWLEIIESGTKYIVRVEERIMTRDEEILENQNIIAKKDAIILYIDAKSGEIVKNKNDYVKKGEVIISGDIKLNEESKKQKTALGNIYGEVWYKVTVEYPLNYKEEYLTGKKKKVLALKIFNKYYDLTFHKFKNKKTKAKTLLKNNVIPISLEYQEQQELKVIDEKLNYEEAINKAILLAKKKINKKLKEKEHIIDTKKLKVEQNNSKIVLELFLSVCEDITDTEKIVIEEKIE